MLGTAYAATATGARLSLAIVLSGPITVVPRRDKANPFRRSSILFRPHCPPMTGYLVEPPGTAPGSDPLITSAFMSIVPEGTRFRYASQCENASVSSCLAIPNKRCGCFRQPSLGKGYGKPRCAKSTGDPALFVDDVHVVACLFKTVTEVP